MSNYLLKFKGKYRILPDLDKETNDFVRDELGNISDDHIFIACQHGNTIRTYGHIDGSRAVYLTAYIPSLGRGRNIKKAMDAQGIEYVQYIETDEEVEFKFKALDICQIAELLKARTSGASISPFSTKNLPKANNVQIPTDEIARYKEITASLPISELLVIHRATQAFLAKNLTRKCKAVDKTFNVSDDIRKLKMSRMIKEYIYYKGFWDDYLNFLKKEIKNQTNNKEW